MKVYYNDRGFQLGNLLFVLMQAHKDRLAGIGESYVLRTGYFKFAQSFFPKTERLFGKAQGCELEPFGYIKYQEKIITQRYWTRFVGNIYWKEQKIYLASLKIKT